MLRRPLTSPSRLGLTALVLLAGAGLPACGGTPCKCLVATDGGAGNGGSGGAVGTGGAGGAAEGPGGAGGRNEGGGGGAAGGAAGWNAGGWGGGGRPGTGGRMDGGGTDSTDAAADGPRDGGATASDGAPSDVLVTGDGSVWHLVWSDEFDEDGAPSSSNWGFEKGFVRNEELQWYQPDNATVSNGILTIAAQQVHVMNPNYVAGSSDWKTNRQYYDYTSSSLTTSGKHAWQYGRFEMRARIDTRQGSWPAFWILGSGTAWPQSGEVDIMEYYANKVLANVCKPSGSTCNWDSVSQSLSSLGNGWTSQFHVWAMEWDASSIDLYLDDALVNHFDVASAVSSGTNPYDSKTFYILINLAIGANGGDPSGTTFPITYDVDYVRVYQH